MIKILKALNQDLFIQFYLWDTERDSLFNYFLKISAKPVAPAGALPHHPLASMENPISTIRIAKSICRFRLEQECANRTPIRAAGIVVTARMANVSRSTYPIEYGGSPATPHPVKIYAVTAPHDEKIRQAEDVPTARWIG